MINFMIRQIQKNILSHLKKKDLQVNLACENKSLRIWQTIAAPKRKPNNG